MSGVQVAVLFGVLVLMAFTGFGVVQALMADAGGRPLMPWWSGLALGVVVAVVMTYSVAVAHVVRWLTTK